MRTTSAHRLTTGLRTCLLLAELAPGGVRPRRVATVVPADSVRALVQQAVREARSQHWSVLRSAERLMVRAHGNPTVLRAACDRLRRRPPRQPGAWHARAMAALLVAIAAAEERRDHRTPRAGASP